MTRKKNPFEVIGVAPSAIRGLSSEQIRSILKHLVRGQRAAHHPDHGGDNEKVRAVNNAYRSLEGVRAFARHKAAYLKQTPLNRRISELEEELQLSGTLLLEQAGHLWSYLMALYARSPESDEASIFHARNVYVSDPLQQLIRAIARPTYISSKIEKGMVYLLDSCEGIPRRRYIKQENKNTPAEEYSDELFKEKRLVGCLPREAIKKLGGKGAVLLLLQGHVETLAKKGVMKVTGNARDEVLQNQIHLEHFKAVIPHLSPKIKPESFLFAVNLQGPSAPFISLEGLVIKKPSRA